MISILAFCSCTKEKQEPNKVFKEYTVPAEVEPYIKRFADEAKAHGQEFNFRSSGLIIEFADNKEEQWAGKCFVYQDPIKILFDRETWDAYKETHNGEMLIENLVFHEMAHGFLRREHKNDLLPNGDWASIMCGSDTYTLPIEKQGWNINYRGYRKDYYIDELFTPTTPAPSWATEKPVFNDNPNNNILFVDEFNNNLQQWEEYNSSERKAIVQNGIYQYTSYGSMLYAAAKQIPIDTTQNFYIEVNMKIVSQNISDYCGVIWGGDESNNLYYFSIANDKHIEIGNFMNYGYYIDLYSDYIKVNDYNKLVIRSSGGLFYFYINDNFIYSTDHEGFYGNITGFYLSEKASVAVDRIQVSHPATIAKNKADADMSNNKTINLILPPKKIRPAN